MNNAVFVPCNAGDNWANIQKAIDYVSSLKPDKQGFRGAVLLGKGTYTLSRELLFIQHRVWCCVEPTRSKRCCQNRC